MCTGRTGRVYRTRPVWRPNASGHCLTAMCPILNEVAIAAMSPMRPDASSVDDRTQDGQRSVKFRELLEALWADQTRLVTLDRTLLESDKF